MQSMIFNKKILYFLAALLLLASVITAQEKKKELDTDLLDKLRRMELEDILDIKISVATHTPLNMREAPGIITLITKEDIINSGARDLIDVFNLLVPGFTFLQSEYGPVGIGVRGIWAYEGKVLMMIDGVEVNEEAYAGVIFGSHYLPENIERIEVIRGPGSVIYGGYAGLGVINIITKNYNDMYGSYVGLQYSQMISSYSHRNLSFGTGNKANSFAWSLTGYAGQGKLSDRRFIPYFSGESYNATRIKFTPLHLNLNLKYKDLDFRAIVDKYDIFFDVPFRFPALHLKLEHKYKFDDKTLLTTKVTQKIQKSWDVYGTGTLFMDGEIIDTAYSNDKVIYKTVGAANLACEIIPNLNLFSGVEVQHAHVSVGGRKGYYEIPFGNQGADDLDLTTMVAYSQLIYQHKITNITIGGRYEKSDVFGASFVPRIAFTKIFNDFHFKAMFSQSHRTPAGKYYDTNLKPERGVNYEIELGYQVSNHHSFTVNFFDITMNDLISFRQNPQTGLYFYDNLDKIQNEGFEIEYKMDYPGFRMGVNFSNYHTVENTVELYKIDNISNQVLGIPPIKLNIFGGIKINENISINPSLSYFGERYGYIEGTLAEPSPGVYYIDNTLYHFDPSIIFNINFRTRDLFTRGLDIDLGIKNLFDNDHEFIQPFKGYKAPLPAPTSSLTLRLFYETDFTF